jgi:Neuraminidase (sialidase)
MDVLFYKLKDKIDISLWRALNSYYKTSKGKVKSDNKEPKEFTIKEGVKQEGILSPYLFNFFMNELLNESDTKGLGANIRKM